MSDRDVRWIQRFNHFKQAFSQLEKAVMLADQRSLTELEEQGLIQAFEFTHELAWNTIKDYLQEQGAVTLYGSKDSTREAYKYHLVENGEIWMEMIESRNLSAHTYNRDLAKRIVQAIRDQYYDEFKQLIITLEPLADQR
jgi:nucleotidyltransferase substrate binding protein (TIGR01987 family)